MRNASLEGELRSAVRSVVEASCHETYQKQVLFAALGRPGYTLHRESPCRAGWLALEVYSCVRGAPEQPAFTGAAAVELLMNAAFMFDNVADDEPDAYRPLPRGQELALAITLYGCGMAAIHRVATSVGSGALELIRVCNDCVLGASAGQFIDSAAADSPGFDLDDSMRMTSLKAGKFGVLAATIGATLARCESEQLQAFGKLGSNLFTYAQLIDDLRDASSPDGACDRTIGKRSVPLTYFLTRSAYREVGNGGSIELAEQAHADYLSSGAPLFGAIVAEACLIRARRALGELRERYHSTDDLQRFVESMATQGPETTPFLACG